MTAPKLSTFLLANLLIAQAGCSLKHVEENKQHAARLQIASFCRALVEHRRSHGTYPSETESLAALLKPPNTLPYIPKDPWGNDYIYTVPASGTCKPLVKSLGADGKPGGSGYDADIDAASCDLPSSCI